MALAKEHIPDLWREVTEQIRDEKWTKMINGYKFTHQTAFAALRKEAGFYKNQNVF